ncbi:MAG: hypothetical protein ACTS27_03545 [Phycisphaerales bacterium]
MTGFDAEKFDKLIASRAPKTPPPAFNADAEGAIESLLVHSFLLYDSSADAADRAMKKLVGSFVDFNELRVAREDDIAAAIGVRYPGVSERAALLKRALNAVFDREHAVSLVGLLSKNKRDAKQYLASLDGCNAYVSSRVLLLGCTGHAVPVDGLLLSRLQDASALEDDVDLDRAVSLLERHVKAADAYVTHLALEALREEPAKPKPKSRAPAKSGKSS